MIKIIKDEETIKEYIENVEKIFKFYKLSDDFGVRENYKNKKIKKLFKKIEENSSDFGGELQTKILRENLLGDVSLNVIAKEMDYSTSHLYTIRQKMLKEFASIIFEVILI